MTIGRTEFDGDSHTSVCYFLGMTVLFGARTSLFKSPICKGVGEAFRLPQQAGKSPKRVGRSGK